MLEEPLKAALEKTTGRRVIDFDPVIHNNQNYSYAADGEPILWNFMTRLGQVIGGCDQGRGFDLFWDGEEWHTAKHGVFTEKWVFLTDYHGFPHGAIFQRADKEV